MKYFLSEAITLKRLKSLDATRSVFSATGTSEGYLASWQEPNPEKIAMYEGEIGKTFVAFLDISCPVMPGDQVVKDGVIYSVRNIKINEFGSTHYKRIVVVQGD
jgi:hypothetical protein